MHKNPEAKIFCHAPSEQESSPLRILNKVLINKLINNKSRKEIVQALLIATHTEYSELYMTMLLC